MDEETFDDVEVYTSIEQFLEFGEETFGTAHKGYYSGGSFVARALRYHLKQLGNKVDNAKD